MSNIHGLNTNPRNPAGPSAFDTLSQGMLPSNPAFPKDPREETFLEMLKFNFCPHFSIYSFSILLGIILLAIFLIETIIDGLNTSKIAYYFLPVNLLGPFTKTFKADFESTFRNYQIWRLITSIFLNQSVNQLLANLLSLIIFVSFFERLIIPNRIRLYFALGGLLGNIVGLGITQTGSMSLGPEPGIFGIYGAVFGFLMFNWKNMEASANLRTMWVFQTMMILVFSYFSIGGNGNGWMIFGGLISGFFVGLSFSDSVDNRTSNFSRDPREDLLNRIGYVYFVLVASFFLVVLIFGN